MLMLTVGRLARFEDCLQHTFLSGFVTGFVLTMHDLVAAPSNNLLPPVPRGNHGCVVEISDSVFAVYNNDIFVHIVKERAEIVLTLAKLLGTLGHEFFQVQVRVFQPAFGFLDTQHDFYLRHKLDIVDRF